MNNYNYSNGTKSQARGGISFFGLLTIVFIVLKLCGVIQWSWVWVVAPIWIPTALFLGISLIIGIIILIIDRAVKK